MKKKTTITFEEKSFEVELQQYGDPVNNIFQATFLDDHAVTLFGDHLIFIGNQMYTRSGLILFENEMIIRQILYKAWLEN